MKCFRETVAVDPRKKQHCLKLREGRGLCHCRQSVAAGIVEADVAGGTRPQKLQSLLALYGPANWKQIWKMTVLNLRD